MAATRQSGELGLRRPDLFREQAFVAGEWIAGAASLPVVNPATGRTIGETPALGRQETEQAVAAAAEAFRHWRLRTAGERGAVLRRWGELMMAHQEDLARILSGEQGKPLFEARAEVAYAASFLTWFAEEARRTYGDVIPGHAADRRVTVLREPVGVVAAITPWNFPLAMITRKAGPALAVGCTLVLKPSDLTPFSALALAVLAQEAGAPAGVFNVVTGAPQEIGDVLVEDPRIAKFTFTGSTAVGKTLAARCMGTVKRVSLELGGNAPFIVFDDADLDAAVEGAVASKFRNGGQTCVCANRFLVQDGIRPAFVQRLAERVQALTLGDALSTEAHMGPLIDERARRKVHAHVEDALSRGARLMAGGAPVDGAGYFYRPTLLDEVSPAAMLSREETFGPVAGVLGFRDEAEAIAMANDTRAGLAAYVFTRDLSRSHRVSEALEYGMVGLNTGLITTETAPFGGVKESGLGREGSRYGVDDYLNMKVVCTGL